MRKILALLILLAIPAVAQFGGPMGGMGRPGAIQGGGLLPGLGGDPLWVAAGPVKPTFDLPLATRKDLTDAVSGKTSIVTFSRSAAQSPGTYVGADGLIKTAAVNLALYSEQFDNAAWIKENASVLANQTVAPDGKQTADKIVATANSGTHRVYDLLSPQPTLSVYAKAAELDYVFIRGGGTSPVAIAVFNLATATLDYQQNTLSTSIESVGNGWFRVGMTGVTSFQAPNVGVADSSYSIVSNEVQFTGDGTSGIYIWGAQLQEGTTATPYIKTTSQALAAPRFDHDPVTGESLGLLVEEQRTNLFLNSNTLATQTITTTAAAHTLSFYGTGTVVLSGTHTATVVGTGAYPARTTLTFTPTAGSLTATVTGTVEFAQLEAGAFPSSYIPTAGSAQTRYADVAAVEGTDFSSWFNATEGTLYAKFRSPTEATRGVASLDDGTANEAMALQSFYSTGAQFVVTDGGTQQVNTAASIITDGAAYVGVAGYKLNDFAVATAGDVAIDVAGTIPTVDRLRIGANQGGDYLNGHIERLAYWPVRQTNTTLDVISEPVQNDSYQILVKTDNAGTSTSTQFTIPANAGTYNVDWGDGTTSTGLTGAQTHTYPTAGQYVIRMDGITHYQTINAGDKLKLLDVQNWGDEAWTSMAYAYWGASNMTMSATDAPDLSGVTSLLFLFNGCSSFNQPVNHWDVSNVTQINGCFRSCTLFNQPLDNWDVSNITDMGAVFASASSFNQPIGNWNTGKVGNMNSMFSFANSFNQPIGSWDVSEVTNMGGMFFFNPAFNQPINDWDVSKATNMENMFRSATAFNEPIGDWDVSSVTNYANFMSGKTNLNYSTANLDAIYNGWIANELSPSETITFGSIKYTAAGAEGKALLTRANATVAVSNAVDNGSGLVRLTTAAHGLSTGNKVYIKDIVGTTEANGLHTVTVVDATTLDLQGSTFTNAYTSGGTVRTGYGWTITDGGI